MKYRLTSAANRLAGQPMFEVLARVKEMEKSGVDIIHFEIGDPDFDTPKNIIEAACESLKSGKTHYAPSFGISEFREVIQNVTLNSRGFKPDLSQILVTPGANIIIYYAIRCLVEPGDEVIIPDPGFPSYYSAINFCGAVAVPMPLKEENGFRVDIDDLKNKITEKTRLIIINSPQNPTGSVMTEKNMQDIYDICEEKDIFLYSDEIYSRMNFSDDIKFFTPGKFDLCKKRTIIANGFSKAFAMTGWRLGVAIGPEDVIAKMNLLLQTTSSCVSPFIQYAGIEAVNGNQDDVKKMMNEYKERRNIIVEKLNEIKGIKCLMPGGAFYVFPNITGTGMTSEEFAAFALKEAKVALLPGDNFGLAGSGYVRLCYATSKEKIIEGMRRLKQAIEKYNN